MGLGWTSSSEQKCITFRHRTILPGNHPSHSSLWKQDLDHLLDRPGTAWGISHLRGLPNGEQEQVEAWPLEWVGLPKVGGYFEGVRDDNDRGVHSNFPADGCRVRCNPPDLRQMQTGWAQEGGLTTPLMVGATHGSVRPWRSTTLNLFARGEGELAWWVLAKV